MPVEVEVSDTQSHLRVDHSALVRLATSVLSAEKRTDASISIALVDNATIRALNQKHLGHDWPTDVISFPLSAPDEPVLAGELVVSAEMAVAAAAELGLEPGDELRLYVVHGLLHLCGYDDRDESHAFVMRQRQEELMAFARSGTPSGD
ncbi:MAG: rRNA maturation RNase YbeY [Isosphaerales bacterium]